MFALERGDCNQVPTIARECRIFASVENVVLPMLTALDRSPEAHLHTWLRKAFNALTPQDIHALKVDSEGFPKFDRMLCSWFARRDRASLGLELRPTLRRP